MHNAKRSIVRGYVGLSTSGAKTDLLGAKVRVNTGAALFYSTRVLDAYQSHEVG